MTKSYKDIIAETSSNIAKLRKDIPDTMQGFYALSGAAGKAGAGIFFWQTNVGR